MECDVNHIVFPTGVGMNRFMEDANNRDEGVPHRRGDEPAESAIRL